MRFCPDCGKMLIPKNLRLNVIADMRKRYLMKALGKSINLKGKEKKRMKLL